MGINQSLSERYDVSGHPADPDFVSSPSRRIVARLLLVLALAHSVAVTLWIMPSNPIREAVGNERLTSYIWPMFDQNWSVFAPQPGVSNSSLSVRAYIGEPGGDGEVTDWVNVVAESQAHLRYDIAPSRALSIGRLLAGTMTRELNSLSDEQRRLVLAQYSVTPVAELGRRLEKASPGYDAGGYLLEEARLTTLATLLARAVWGSEVSLVQFKVATHSVPPYADRTVASYSIAEGSETSVGWRAAKDVPEEAQRAFDDYVQDGFR